MHLDSRLRQLIADRLRDGASAEEKAAIDAQIWSEFGEEWCVMATDLSGFSRNVAKFGIIHFLQTIFESERLLLPIVERHHGKLLKVEGDSFFVIFREPVDALHAAVAMQRAVRDYNLTQPPEEQVLLGVGLGFGQVLRTGDEDVFGNEVNSACILGESYAKAFDILVTDAVRVRAGDALQFEEFEPVPPGAGRAWKVVYSSSSDAANGD